VTFYFNKGKKKEEKKFENSRANESVNKKKKEMKYSSSNTRFKHTPKEIYQ
jgi:hypothetical protein